MVPRATEVVGAVITVGEALVCLATESGSMETATRFERSLAGAEANTAVGLARLGDLVSWVSKVAHDPFGDGIVQSLAAEGVDVSLVRRSSGGYTGLILKDRPTPHQARWVYYRDHSAGTELDPDDLPTERLAQAALLHVTGITLALGDGPRALVFRALARARDHGVMVTFDPNFRPQLQSEGEARRTYADVLPFVDHVLCNEHEAMLMTGERDPVRAAWRLTTAGPTGAIVKRGIDGAVAVVDGAEYRCDAYTAPDPVDPTGAGDAFNAGWIHGTLRGEDPQARLELAAFVASQVVQHSGDHSGFPSREVVDGWAGRLEPTDDQR